MKLGKRKPSGREKDEASIELLNQLREKLYSGDSSTGRRAAFNLSWMQEDGLEILREALFSNFSRTTKNAAAYGLRSMRGRMKKAALEVFEQGLGHANSDTREVCKKALSDVKAKASRRPAPKKKARAGKFEIREISRKKRHKRKTHKKRGNERFQRNRGFSRT
jgi:hypothetical protein